jgi:hypothetical protein
MINLKDLSSSEMQYLRNTDGFALVQRTLSDVAATYCGSVEKHPKTLGLRIANFTEKLATFVVRWDGIVRLLLPQSPEYTSSYGAVLVLCKVTRPSSKLCIS